MDYRFFKLNLGGVIDTAQTVRLPSDDAAVMHAKGLGKGCSVEIWIGSRKLAVVPPEARR